MDSCEFSMHAHSRRADIPLKLVCAHDDWEISRHENEIYNHPSDDSSRESYKLFIDAIKIAEA